MRRCSYYGIAALAFLASMAMAFALPFVFSIPPQSVPTARWTLLLTGAAIAQGFVFNVFTGVLMGLQRWYLVVRMGVVFSLIRAGLIVAALSNGLGIVALGAIQLIVGTVLGLVVLFFARRSLPSYRPRVVRPAREELTRVFGYAKYVFGNNIGEKLVFRTDALVIGVSAGGVSRALRDRRESGDAYATPCIHHGLRAEPGQQRLGGEARFRPVEGAVSSPPKRRF
jgi:O-antigen/teichoic acid export membrane protein